MVCLSRLVRYAFLCTLCLFLLLPLAACGGADTTAAVEVSPGEAAGQDVDDGAEAHVPSQDVDPGLTVNTGDNLLDAEIARVLEEIGGLAYDEAYQFMLADGRYVMLTGWRPLASVEEVLRYYPNLHLPEQAGDFRFQTFASSSFAVDFMLGDEPFQYGSVQQDFTEFSNLPLGEVFVRDFVLHGFSMIYENPLGERAHLMVSWGRHLEICGLIFSCTIYDDIHFVEMPGEGYWQAIYSSEVHGLMVTMEMIDADYPNGLPGYLELEAFFAFAEIFDLPGLIDRFAGRLVPWDDERAVTWISPPCPGWVC